MPEPTADARPPTVERAHPQGAVDVVLVAVTDELTGCIQPEFLDNPFSPAMLLSPIRRSA